VSPLMSTTSRILYLDQTCSDCPSRSSRFSLVVANILTVLQYV
jgi:hypothetical protein